MTVAARFAPKFEPCLMSGCWLWTDAPDSYGYGRMMVDGRLVKAHRLSYELHTAAIPDGLKVCHQCDTPACVNPAHLFVGTQTENIADCHSKGRGNTVPPPPQRGIAHPRAKLTDAVVRDLRDRRARGERVNLSVEAPRLGVGISSLSRAINGLTWTHLGFGEGPEERRDAPEDWPLADGPPSLDLFEEIQP